MKTFCVLDFINVNNFELHASDPFACTWFWLSHNERLEWLGCLCDLPFRCSVTWQNSEPKSFPLLAGNNSGHRQSGRIRMSCSTLYHKPRGLTDTLQWQIYAYHLRIKAWINVFITIPSLLIDWKLTNQSPRIIGSGGQPNLFSTREKTQCLYYLENEKHLPFFYLTELLVQSLNVELVKLASSTIFPRTCSAVFVLAMVPT